MFMWGKEMKPRIDELVMITHKNITTMDIINLVLTSPVADENWIEIKKEFDKWEIESYRLNSVIFGLMVKGYIIGIISDKSKIVPRLGDDLYLRISKIGYFSIYIPFKKYDGNEDYHIKELHKVVV